MTTIRSYSRNKIAKDWGKLAFETYSHPNADLARQDLARILRVTIDSLERICVGWSGRDRGWSYPDRNDSGDVIGICRQLLNGEIRREPGSRAGLVFDIGAWSGRDYSTDAYVVSGMSNLVAMLSMGFHAVAYSGNVGGSELLGKLLVRVSADRRIVIVGERDNRTHTSLAIATRNRHQPDCQGCLVCWPGRFTAVRVAERLAEILNREVYWTLPPETAANIHDWFKESSKMVGQES